ncbi:cytochrome c/c1 heme-lyase [Cantharellus anzutake]|uniref:cytochrome c/c1 heme-lyase n=1 Tax=Cantharellus anzutake TaxID=1750568 RepID=UPI0019071021|nr:cytochrome c/c1 heme-lyase [Cantharellus anzutake]KAF8324316.1 cytochrome c/c1 heme-lyase [Cantharellus anzutake]
MGQAISSGHSQPALPPEHPPVSSSTSSPPPTCPMHRGGSGSDVVNPLNNMPNLPQTPAHNQKSSLPIERTESSIPRAPSPDSESSNSEKWEYPSPQQFYNALVRKGWVTPEEHVEMMVEIHNFLNEMAWKEVVKWEAESQPGAPEPRLARFQGKPGELSPKARFWLGMGKIFPSRFNTVPPFDRHDWVVRRHTGEEVRYVIDYYEAPPDGDGSPIFSLDVRPALDSFGSIKTRIVSATKDAWTALREKENGVGR